MAVVGWLVFSSAGAIACLALGAVWALVSRGSLASRRFLALCAVFYWLAVRLGVPRDRIIVEANSMTTHHEAVLVKEILRTHPVDHVVLVTSQFHMLRSAGAFRAEGVEVIPAIAREPQGVDDWWEKLIPTDKGMEESGMAAHELAGIVAYAVRGWYRGRPL